MTAKWATVRSSLNFYKLSLMTYDLNTDDFFEGKTGQVLPKEFVAFLKTAAASFTMR